MRKNHLILSIALVLMTITGYQKAAIAQDSQASGNAIPEPVLPTLAETDDALSDVAPENANRVTQAAGGIKEIEWDALIPEDWRPDKLFEGLEDMDLENLTDDDPRAQELLAKLQEFAKQSPVVDDLDQQKVKLPGFMVPLEMDAKQIREFLLVPYYGACIHTPPPPANQTVHVVVKAGDGYKGQLFDTVWVSGTMRVEHLSSDLADAGYRIENAIVTPYE